MPMVFGISSLSLAIAFPHSVSRVEMALLTDSCLKCLDLVSQDGLDGEDFILQLGVSLNFKPERRPATRPKWGLNQLLSWHIELAECPPSFTQLDILN